MQGRGPKEDPLSRSVRARRHRRERWEKEGERPLAKTLAMIGALGWLVVIPTLVGIFVGRWLDRAFGTGIMWTAALLVVGVALGCRMAWKRIHHE